MRTGQLTVLAMMPGLFSCQKGLTKTGLRLTRI